MPRYSIKAILIFTAVMAVVAAICAALPVFEFRDLGYAKFPWKSLVSRDPTFPEFSLRFVLAAPVVSFLHLMSSQHRKALHALQGRDR